MLRPRNRFLRYLRARPRLFIAAAVGVGVGLALPEQVFSEFVTRWLLAWNAGTSLYVTLAAIMMVRSTEHRMHQRAQLQDEGQWVILALVFVSAMASLVAIAGELAVVKDMHGLQRGLRVGLAGYTVLSSWAFAQMMFALHYAHEYYAAASHHRKPGLLFPDDEAPGYGDFFYFSAIIGTSGQTADVSFVSKPLRRTGTLHCILAYLFNTTVLALLINIGASMF